MMDNRGSRIRQRRRRDVEVKILESFIVYSIFKHVYKHNTQTKIQGISFLFLIPFFFCLSLFHYIFPFFLKIKREGGVSKERQWFLLHCICNFLEIIYDAYGSPGGLYIQNKLQNHTSNCIMYICWLYISDKFDTHELKTE